MAYQVAQAYDENKNLVPLYVLTDGEVPEVSPGFSATRNAAFIYIVATSTNPVGGDVFIETAIQISSATTIYNQSNFKISVSGVSGNGYNFNPITIEPQSSVVVNWSNNYNYATTITLTIQRIRT